MTKTASLFIVALAVALVATACDSDDDTPSLDGRTIRVGVENAYVPFNFISEETGEPGGFDYDIWREICDRLGCTAEFVEAEWPQVIEQTGQGVYDVAADGISITNERKEIVAFSEPYLTTIQRYLVRADEERFTTADEFNEGDYRLGTRANTTNYKLGADLIGDGRIDTYDRFADAVQALIAGDVDAVIIDDVSGLGYVGVSADATKLLQGNLQSDPLGFIYPLDSDLIDPVDEVLAEMEEDGTLRTLISIWFIDFTG